MIDDQTMAAFRMAATLVHALPGLGLEVDGAGAAFRVGRELPESDHQASPCGFRVAVARAHRLRAPGRHGRPLGAEQQPRTLHDGDAGLGERSEPSQM